MSGGRIVELSDAELEEQLEMCNQLANELDGWMEKLAEMNRVSNGVSYATLPFFAFLGPDLESNIHFCPFHFPTITAILIPKRKFLVLIPINFNFSLLDIYRRDDGHNLSHLSSKLNTQWTKFNDQLQRSRHDFQTALGHLQQWMNRQSRELQIQATVIQSSPQPAPITASQVVQGMRFMGWSEIYASKFALPN